LFTIEIPIAKLVSLIIENNTWINIEGVVVKIY